jgi:hypothetical protein
LTRLRELSLPFTLLYLELKPVSVSRASSVTKITLAPRLLPRKKREKVVLRQARPRPRIS